MAIITYLATQWIES